MTLTRRTERGSVLTETALVLPFLLLLTLGVVDIGRAYFDAARIQEAAQEGAMYAALNPGSPTDAIARAEEVNAKPDVTGAVTVTCPATDQVTVTVSYTFDLVTPLIGNLLGSTLDLSHSETSQVLSSDPCTASP
jgi:Flp pilus assembly protein TadG